jgi:hypothetical protein
MVLLNLFHNQGRGRPIGGVTVDNKNLFNIDFETGDLSQFDSVVDNGEISVTEAAALNDTAYGLELDTTARTNNYGSFGFTAPASGLFRFRFYIDPNSMPMGEAEKFDILEIMAPGEGPPGMLHEVKLRHHAGQGGYSIIVDTNDDDDVENDMTRETISDGPHYIEILSQRASAEGVSDGEVTLWIDGDLKQTVTGIKTFLDWNVINEVRFGIDFGVDAGTSGVFYLDELAANNHGGEIGA